MDPIEARKQKVLGTADDARRPDTLTRAREQAERIFRGGAQNVELQPTDDLDAERRALGLAPCLECAEYFLPGRSTQTRCEKCVKPRPAGPARSGIANARSLRSATGYDAASILALASSLDLVASVVVVLSASTGALVGALPIAQALRGDVSDVLLWIFIMLAGTLGGLVGLVLGRLNVLAIRLFGQLSRCLVEIERSVRAP